MIIAIIILSILGIELIAGIVWCIKPYKAMSWLYHDIMGWHKPNNKYYNDGCSNHSICRLCGKDIMQDSQGNWF